MTGDKNGGSTGPSYAWARSYNEGSVVRSSSHPVLNDVAHVLLEPHDPVRIFVLDFQSVGPAKLA